MPDARLLLDTEVAMNLDEWGPLDFYDAALRYLEADLRVPSDLIARLEAAGYSVTRFT